MIIDHTLDHVREVVIAFPLQCFAGAVLAIIWVGAYRTIREFIR